MRSTMMAGLLLGALVLSQASAQAEVVQQLNITGGSAVLNLGNGNPLFGGSFTQNGSLLMGQYQAVLGPTPVFATDVVVGGHSFSFFTNPGPDSLPTPSGQISGNTIQVNLNALFATINGPLMTAGLNLGNQLPALATGSYDPGTGAFHIAWDHIYNLPEDFVGTGSFELQGTTSVVPLPAAVWLFGTGLLGIARLARMRKV